MIGEVFSLAVRGARRAQRGVDWLRAEALFRHADLGSRVAATGYVRLANEHGRIYLGSRCTFLGGTVPSEIVCRPGATLSVGEETLFNYGVLLDASHRVDIGRRCMFASFVVVCDASRAKTAPIVIEDDVWVAHGAIIRPGVTIGRGAVISARAVVETDVPPESLAIGNPARVMGFSLFSR